LPYIRLYFTIRNLEVVPCRFANVGIGASVPGLDANGIAEVARELLTTRTTEEIQP